MKTAHTRPDYSDVNAAGALPFAIEAKSADARRGFWNIPPAEDFQAGHVIGYEFGAHYLAYLRDQARFGDADGMVGGLLRNVVEDMLKQADETEGARGIRCGFFNFIDTVLCETVQRLDPWERYQQITTYWAEQEAKYVRYYVASKDERGVSRILGPIRVTKEEAEHDLAALKDDTAYIVMSRSEPDAGSKQRKGGRT